MKTNNTNNTLKIQTVQQPELEKTKSHELSEKLKGEKSESDEGSHAQGTKESVGESFGEGRWTKEEHVRFISGIIHFTNVFSA